MGGDDASGAADTSASGGSLPALAVAGGISGLVSRFATHPMDTLKTQMQVQGAVAGAAGGARGAGAASLARYRGVFDGIGKILAREGPVGLYRGFGAVVTAAPFASAAYFGGYETAKRLVPESALGPSAAYLVSGMLAQSFAGVVYTPMDVVKERLQARVVLGAHGAGDYRDFLTAYRTILAREGPRGLFRGYWASNFTWWPWSAVYFLAYEHGRDATARVLDVTDKEALPPWVSSACATAAAAAATAATHPLDLAKTRMQTLRVRSEGAESSAPGSAPRISSRAGVFGVMRDVARREGVAALTAGAGARVLAVAPGSAVSFFVYETIKGWLGTED